jgi:predicted nucleotidyltransferase
MAPSSDEVNALPLPPFNEFGDLPVGVHMATLHEIGARFGAETARRRQVFLRLQHLHVIARATGHLSRMVVFGSFVTRKADPNDVDVFLLMADTFDVAQVAGETRLLFDHLAAEAHFGASVFWLRRMATFEGEQAAVEYWQVKRDGQLRGIVEIDLETS